jgi:hypothetical protein
MPRKDIIEKSAVVAKDEVNIPGTSTKTSLSELSKTGAFANAFEAVKMADEMSKKMAVPVKPKTVPKKPVAKSK